MSVSKIFRKPMRFAVLLAVANISCLFQKKKQGMIQDKSYIRLLSQMAGVCSA